ncbi:BI1 inhibitor, partial [Bucorvus abyssinicus]|nr:BI1 inhibitor [Bucorvus abyssinicus]
MNVFDRNINFDALFKFSHISASTQEHLKRVYASFALCMFVAAAGAYVNMVTHLFQFSLLTGLGALGLMVWLTATPHSRETEQKRLGMLAGFAFLTGINLGPLLEMCISINPSLTPCLLSAGFLLSGLTLMLLSSVVNAFMRSTWLFTVRPSAICQHGWKDGQTDTNPSLIRIEKAESGDKDYIWHCVDLFLDFVDIFRELLMILGMAEVGDRPPG